MSAKKLNISALSINATDAEKRIITNDSVVRPVRDIIATVNEASRQAAWASVVETVAKMPDKPVEAKGAHWKLTDDEVARALRVNYNLIQPDYFQNRKALKMTEKASQDVWAQICVQLGKDAPRFSESASESASEDTEE